MGEPIKVGDGFGSYNNTKKDIVNMYANRSGFSITASQSYVDNMNVNKGMRVYAQCQRYGNNAKIYADWNDGNQSIYSTEYKPKNMKQSPSDADIKFTTIYDFGYDSKTGKEFYIKAVDINGNNVIDEGEITEYNTSEELFNQE